MPWMRRARLEVLGEPHWDAEMDMALDVCQDSFERRRLKEFRDSKLSLPLKD
jgi:hypothetical protein